MQAHQWSWTEAGWRGVNSSDPNLVLFFGARAARYSLPEPSAQLSLRQDQDRPLLHQWPVDRRRFGCHRARHRGSRQHLGIPTTAEGIETRQQLQQVKALGCSEMQGFRFSPLPRVDEVAQLLRARLDRETVGLDLRRRA